MDTLCERCEERHRQANSDYCEECQEYLSELAWERMLEDGETFRGREAEAYAQEQQLEAQKLK